MKKRIALLMIVTMMVSIFAVPLVYADADETPVDEPIEGEAPEGTTEQEPTVDEHEETSGQEPPVEEPKEGTSEEESPEEPAEGEAPDEAPEEEPIEEISEEEAEEEPTEGETPKEETKLEPPEEEVLEGPVEVEAPEEPAEGETPDEVPDKEPPTRTPSKTELEIVNRPDLGMEVLFIIYRDRVYNQNTGEGLEGVNVIFTNQETKETIETVTDKHGWFEVELQEGIYRIILQRLGFKEIETTIEVVEK